MLEYLRNAAEKPFAKFLIAILAFSFIGWGVAEWIFGGGYGDSTLIRVGGEKIGVSEFNLEKSREMSQMSKEQQRAAYADETAINALNTTIMGTLATRQMAQNRARDLGYVVSDQAIAREIRSYPEFQINGQFSSFLFDGILNNSGYTEAQFASVLRGQTLRTMVLAPMAVAIPVPAFAVRASFNARNATRDIKYATVKYSDFKVGNPDESQLREFYAQNPKIVPEARAISYVLVPADISKPDSYDAGYATAQKVEDDIIAGETLATAAKKHGAKYVALEPFAAGNRPTDAVLSDEMVARIFNLDSGVESELIETKSGFVIARVEQVIPEHTADFADARAGLADDWRRAEQRKQAYVRANEILTAARKDDNVAGAKSVSVSRASGAPVQVLAAAFNNPVGTKTIVPADDVFYIVSIDAIHAPTVDGKKMDALRGEMVDASARGIADDYSSFLKRKYPIKVNEKLYNRLIAK